MDSFINIVNSPDSSYTHTAGHNHLSDLSLDEYLVMLNIPQELNMPSQVAQNPLGVDPGKNGEVDYRDGACMPPVRN
jgi:hypothetical protein